jgi:hypothetical protein
VTRRPPTTAALTAALTAAALTALALAPVARVGAQVGYPTSQSPFEDLEYRQSLTLYSGYFRAASDRAAVAPQGGPLIGARYDISLAGPASFTARLGTVLSERTVLDPARSAGRRVLGTERRPIGLLDVGITLGLTGQKSWRGFVPTVHGGAGLASNFAGEDPGGFKFGTRFAIAYGAGLQYVPRGSAWSVRADVGSHLYQIRYPDRYFTAGLDSTSILPSGASKSSWTNNLGATLGISRQFFR